MSRTTKTLTNQEIKSAKAKDKKRKLSDGRGLFLEIRPNGSKYWKLKYRFDNKEYEYSIGVYPTITLVDARKKREELKSLIANGVNPNKAKRESKLQQIYRETKKENTFYHISQKWLDTRIDKVSENYHIKLGRALDNYIYPHIKDKPIEEITRLNIIEIFDTLKAKGIDETARRTKGLLKQIFEYAVIYEYIPHNIIADINSTTILGKKSVTHYPAITDPKEIRELLDRIDRYRGDYSVVMALRLLPYLFVRSSNIRECEWVELDLEAKVWIIPAHKMKTKREFILPLPHQVVTIFREIERNKLSDRYVFVSSVTGGALSSNTLSNALRRMGYSKEKIVPHGFRTTFSTIVSEYANRDKGHNYTSEVREALLAHKESNRVVGAYNRAEYKEPMRGLMQWYADWLSSL